jgi:hypothetical protein
MFHWAPWTQHTSLLFDEREVVAAACSLIAKARKRTSRGRKQDRPRVAGGSMKSAMGKEDRQVEGCGKEGSQEGGRQPQKVEKRLAR